MPLSRETLERQLGLAKQSLSSWSEGLAKKGIEKTAFRRDPQWRRLNADCNQINRRLAALAKTEANNAEVVRRKAEKLAAVESA